MIPVSRTAPFLKDRSILTRPGVTCIIGTGYFSTIVLKGKTFLLLDNKYNFMHTEINDNTTFRELQDLFSSYYPFLRLAFYKEGHRPYETSDEKEAIAPRQKIGDFKKTHVSGLLEILPHYKARGVEKELLSRFGLTAQVLRKDRNCWVQAAGLDDLSLKELNELSRNASDDYVVKDYEEGLNEPETKPERLL